MPKLVKIGPAPGYKATAEKKADFDAIKAKGTLLVPYVTAIEAVQNSGGMYAIVPEVAPAQAPGLRMPEDMSREELILTALQLGIDTSKKQMKKAELVKAIRLAMEDVTLLDDDESDAA